MQEPEVSKIFRNDRKSLHLEVHGQTSGEFPPACPVSGWLNSVTLTDRSSAHTPQEGLGILQAAVHGSANTALLVKALKPRGYRQCCAGRILQPLHHNLSQTVVLAGGAGFLPNGASDGFINPCSHQNGSAALTRSVLLPATNREDVLQVKIWKALLLFLWLRTLSQQKNVMCAFVIKSAPITRYITFFSFNYFPFEGWEQFGKSKWTALHIRKVTCTVIIFF